MSVLLYALHHSCADADLLSITARWTFHLTFSGIGKAWYAVGVNGMTCRGDYRSAVHVLTFSVVKKNNLLTLKKGTFREDECSYFCCMKCDIYTCFK